MAQLFELNSFVGKFVNLWQTGKNATLKLESQAGQASVNLLLDLGHQLPHQHHPHVQGTARDRRRQKRAEERRSAAEKADDDDEAVNREAEEASARAAEEATQAGTPSNVAAKATETDDVMEKTREEAENEATAKVVEVVAETENNILAEKAISDHPCDICDKTFSTPKGLRSHKGQVHKATYSPIPQIDGTSAVLNLAHI